MDQENVTEMNATENKISPLLNKHREFISAVDAAATNADATVLLTVYYPEEKQAAIEYLGTPDAVVEAGLRAILTSK